MAKYTRGDPEVNALEDYDRANYENYLLDYNVDANIETAKSADSMKTIKDVIFGAKAPSFSITNPQAAYLMIYTILISLAIMLILYLIGYILIKLIIWLFKKDDVTKLHMKIAALLIVFVVGMFALVFILTKLKDNVQTLLEKIVYKL